MKSRWGAFSLIGIMMLAGLTGCNIQGLPTQTQPTKPISILFIESPPTSLAVNATANVYAAVENSPANGQVTYTVTCASTGVGACGSFSASNEGGAIVYTAPSAVPSGGTATVTATAAADSTKSISALITIVPPIPITVTFQPLPASLQVNVTVSVSAYVKNDTSANPQVKWTVSCGGAECGSFNPTTMTSDYETAYTAPSAIPPGNTVTVTATSVADPTKSASANITIIAQAPTLANGTYVFQLSGSTGQNANFITGVLVALNGAITGGEQDTVGYTSDEDGDLFPYAFASGQISGGSYGTKPDGNIQIALSNGETLNGVLAPGGKGFVGQLYGSIGSGTLELQSSTAAPAGGYAFSMYGGDQYGEQNSIGGILNVDSPGRISGTGSVLDCTVVGPGVGNSCSTLAASTVSAPDKFGRVQFVLNPGASSVPPVQDLTGYIVDSTHIRLISPPTNNSGNYQGVMGGLALGQGANTGKFSNSSVAGTSYVFGASNEVGYAGNYQIAGVVTPNADGSLAGALNFSYSEEQSPLPVNGTWTIDGTGRATLSNLTNSSVTPGSATNSLYMYLTGDGNALLISSVPATSGAGQAFQQQASAFTAASFSGTYGLNASPANSPVAGSVTSVAMSGSDALAGFAGTGIGAADFAITGSLTPASNGVFTGTLTGLDVASPTKANSFTFYLVDNTRAVAIETDNSQLTLGYFELQQ
jgi:hypothetical protein